MEILVPVGGDSERTIGVEFMLRMVSDPYGVHMESPYVVANSLVKLYGDHVCDGDVARAWEDAQEWLYSYDEVDIDLCEVDGAVTIRVDADCDWLDILPSLAMMCEDAGVSYEKIGHMVNECGITVDERYVADTCGSCEHFSACMEINECIRRGECDRNQLWGCLKRFSSKKEWWCKIGKK